jgi:nitroimidazol reductase NimA-like FMN-containing flavoprotein (pyridoxamine 5'-phosphate oxidase superfamily)
MATNRPDGWPQATTVGYVKDGLTLYFLCSPQSQEAQNLARDGRSSLTIDHDTPTRWQSLAYQWQPWPIR